MLLLVSRLYLVVILIVIAIERPHVLHKPPMCGAQSGVQVELQTRDKI